MKRFFLLILIGIVTLNALYAQSTVPNVWSVTATKNWFVSTASNVRGMGYNPVNNHVYIPSRDVNKVIILNAATGDSVGVLNMTGITGGTLIFNRLAVTSDGRIYTTNLVTTVSKAAPFKIYTWTDESSVPVVAFNDSILGPRLGDALAVVGSGQNTYVYASGNASPGPMHIFKRSGDTLIYYKNVVLSGWGAFGVLGIGPTTNGVGPFWVNTSGTTARKFDSTGAAMDTIPSSIIATGGSSAHYFEYAGRKFVGVYSGNTSPSVFRLADVTNGGASSFVAGITVTLGSTANSNATGEIFFNAGDSSLYAIATNNSVGKFSIKLAAPVVTYNSRVPFVPQAGQNDTVFVNILSMKPITTASLFYYGNKTAVSDQADVDSNIVGVSMSSTNNRVYMGIIPGSVNRNGRRVNGRSEATDNLGVTTKSVTYNGYFAGMTKLAMKDGPRDIDTATGAMRWIGYGIRVQGVCTQEDSLIAVPTSRHDVELQDDLGATDLIEFANSGVAPPWRMKRGNIYSAVGLMAQFNGKLQIGIPGASIVTHIEVVDLGPGVLPAAEPVTVRDIAFDRKGEILENALVRVSHLRLTPGSLPWPAAGAAGTNITVTDNGIDSMTLRVPALSSANGFPPKQPFTVVGLAGQFDAAPPFKEGYQVIMRQADDLIPELVVGLQDKMELIVNTEVVLPVMVGDVTGTGITAYDFAVQFDTTALQFVGANNIGTISSGFTFSTQVVKNGFVQVAAFGTQPLVGSGAVFNYRFKVLKLGSSNIVLTGKFNEGNPLSITKGGVAIGIINPYDDPPAMVAGGMVGALTLDGKLNEPEWTNAPALLFGNGAQFRKQAGDQTVTGGFDIKASFDSWGVTYHLPNTDSSWARVKFLRKGPDLFIGIQSNDKSICKFDWEGEGIFVQIKDKAGVIKEYKLYYQNIDSTANTIKYEETILNSGGGAGFLPVGSTANDTTNVDNGYTAELRIRLDKLGFTMPIDSVQLSVNIFDPDGFQFNSALPWPYGMMPFDSVRGSYFKSWWGSEWGSAFKTVKLMPDPPAPMGITLTTSKIQTTVTNVGHIGGLKDFNDNIGFKFAGLEQMFEGSYIFTTDSAHVSNAWRLRNGNYNPGFRPLKNIKIDTLGSTIRAESVYDDSNQVRPLGIAVTDRSFIDTNSVKAGYLMVQLNVVNTTNAAISKLRVGALLDFDVNAIGSDRGGIVRDSTNVITGVNSGLPFKMHVAYQQAGGNNTVYVGFVPLSQGQLSGGRISSGTLEIYPNPFTDSAKNNYVSTFRATNTFTDNGKNDDQSIIASVGPYNINAKDTARAAFAVISGNSLGDLIATARQAQKDYVAKGNLFGPVTKVDPTELPVTFALDQNYPNPFNPTTKIRFALPNELRVSLKVYDILGREVRTLINGDVAAGNNSIEWNGRNNIGQSVATGVYIYRIEAGSFISTKKMMLLK